MSVKLKFCGLSREEDILAVNTLLPDYIGFVFFEKSKRNVSRERAAGLKALLDKRIKAVGVFVDEDPAYEAELCNSGIIDIIQLHGNEGSEHINSLRSLTNAEIIKAFRIGNSSPEEAAEILKSAAKSPADHILIDSGQGTGKTFNWEILKSFERPYFLAGGLTPRNIKEAVDLLHPYALDLSSGIETDSLKDREKMEVVIKTLRRRMRCSHANTKRGRKQT